MKTLLLSAFVILCGYNVSAQNGAMNKANTLYNNLAYHEASEIYLDLLGSGVDGPKMKLNLADCFYQIGDSKNAAKYYAKVIDSPETSSHDVYQYAQSLKENGQYELSNRYMERFTKMTNVDSRADLYERNRQYLKSIKDQKPYFEVSRLNLNTSATDFGGYIIGDNFYFISNRKESRLIKKTHSWNGGEFLDVYKVNASNLESVTDADRLVKGTNSKYHEGPMCVTPDGSKVYFTRNNVSKGAQRKSEEGVQNLKLYIADIDANGNFVNEKEVSLNSKEYSTGHPTLSKDGKTLYFVSDMPGGYGGADIYKVSINTDGSYGEPINLGSTINTEGQEMFPMLNSEGMLFFASDGHPGLGGLDVYAYIPSFTGSGGEIMNLGEPVNSSRDDFALYVGKDNVNGFVSSNRLNGRTDDDIYAVKLLRPISAGLTISGTVKDNATNMSLSDVTIELIDENGTVVDSKTVDSDGNYEFFVEPDNDYTIRMNKADYFEAKQELSTKNMSSGDEGIVKDFLLEKDPGLALYTLISDSKTKNPIEGVNVTIVDNMTGTEFVSFVTNASGDYLKGISGKKLNDRISYNIRLVKEGYFPKELTFNHQITEPGTINLHEFLKGGLSMDEEVEDLGDLVVINPINFDLNKFNIREDAKVELDKIVTIMNTYPDMIVELGSHTDCRGSKAYNTRLSDKRAKASANYIKSKISNPERITGKGYGETRLINDCDCEGSKKSDCSEEEHAKNRRTEFRVIDSGGGQVENSSTQSFD